MMGNMKGKKFAHASYTFRSCLHPPPCMTHVGTFKVLFMSVNQSVFHDESLRYNKNLEICFKCSVSFEVY